MQAAAQHDGIGHGQGAAVGGHGRLAAPAGNHPPGCRNPAGTAAGRAWRPPPRAARCPARPGSARHGAGPRAGWPAGPQACRERLPVGAGRQCRPPGQVRALHLRGDDRIIHPRSGPARLLQRHVLADHAHTGLATGLVLPCIGFGLNTTEPVAPSAPDRLHARRPPGPRARRAPDPARRTAGAPPRRRTPADADPAPARRPAALAAAPPDPVPDARRPTALPSAGPDGAMLRPASDASAPPRMLTTPGAASPAA